MAQNNQITEEIIAQLQQMISEIESAQEQLQAGTVADLSTLDTKVAEICEETIKLPPAEAMAVQPIMAEMIGKLEAFGLALKDFKNSFQNTQ